MRLETLIRMILIKIKRFIPLSAGWHWIARGMLRCKGHRGGGVCVLDCVNYRSAASRVPQGRLLRHFFYKGNPIKFFGSRPPTEF